MGLHFDDKIRWIGNSGTKYEYWVFPLDHAFTGDEVGSFIFAKEEGDNWEAVYIGEGNLQTLVQQMLEEGCVIEKGATHIHANLSDDNFFRQRANVDLLAARLEAYAPTGCNVQAGW